MRAWFNFEVLKTICSPETVASQEEAHQAQRDTQSARLRGLPGGAEQSHLEREREVQAEMAKFQFRADTLREARERETLSRLQQLESEHNVQELETLQEEQAVETRRFQDAVSYVGDREGPPIINELRAYHPQGRDESSEEVEAEHVSGQDADDAERSVKLCSDLAVCRS